MTLVIWDNELQNEDTLLRKIKNVNGDENYDLQRNRNRN